MKSKSLPSKSKILSFFLCLLIGLEVLAGSSQGYRPADSQGRETYDIRVAMYAEDILIASGVDVFSQILKEYQWTVGEITYRVVLAPLYDKDIYRGRLTTKNFDVFFMPGGGGGGYVTLTKAYPRLFWVKLWKQNVEQFIKDGGSYFGICGGTYSFLGLDRAARTPFENYFIKSALNVSVVRLSFESYANPIFCQVVGLPPESVGQAAYLYYTGWNATGPVYSGIPLDVSLNRSHPLFDDFLSETERIRWIGGPAYTVPAHPDRTVSVIAWYPALEMSENYSTRIHAWKYSGGLRGFLPGFFTSFGQARTLIEGLLNVYTRARDWEMTQTIIATNFSNKPFMTAEVYPNEKAARILIYSGHPEYPVWWGGYIKDANDTAQNSLYDSLYHWTGIVAENQTKEDEATYNWWMIRRGIAWSAKLPDNDLPPVYGASQVSDIAPYHQPVQFTLTGNAEKTSGIPTLELYYRYSIDNLSWGPWTYYASDSSESDGWFWMFHASSANGVGYYQFYSLRKVQTMNELLIETAPPGPDAIAFVQ
jgi:hypothetical protein